MLTSSWLTVLVHQCFSKCPQRPHDVNSELCLVCFAKQGLLKSVCYYLQACFPAERNCLHIGVSFCLTLLNVNKCQSNPCAPHSRICCFHVLKSQRWNTRGGLDTPSPGRRRRHGSENREVRRFFVTQQMLGGVCWLRGCWVFRFCFRHSGRWQNPCS